MFLKIQFTNEQNTVIRLKSLYVFISFYFVQICTLHVPRHLLTPVDTGILISVSASRLHKTKQNKESQLKYYKIAF